MASTAKLKLDGQPFTPKLAPRIVIQKFLSESPADEVFTSRNLAEKTGLMQQQVKDSVQAIWPDFHCIVARTRYWGNPKAIKELRRQVGE